MRIAIAGLSHESLNFSPIPTTSADFQVLRGEQILAGNHPHAPYPAKQPRLATATQTYADIPDMLRALGVEPVPILFARALPSGIVEEQTYLQFREEIVRGIRKAGPLDGICLILHGALLVENIWSGETDLVREIRAVVGNAVPIAVRFDLHGNLTEEFANKADIWTVFRTAPHRDAPETLERAMTLLVRCIREGLRPRPAFIRIPLLIPGEKSTTDARPMQSLLELVEEVGQMSGILTAELLVGFGWADAPHASSSIVVIAEDEAHLPTARREAVRLAQAMWDQRHNFTFDRDVAASVDEAIDMALQASESTVFISDGGDNPTAGAPGDTTNFLARLLARQVPDVVVAGIPDPDVARICFQHGVGATVTISLGGKLDTRHCTPVEVTGVVEHLYQPSTGEAGVATLRAGGVRVLVTDTRKAFMTLADFRKAGIDPLAHKIVVVKLGYLFPELRDIAPREILALSPGYSDLDLTRLPYKYVTRPIFPLDPDFTWRPIITNSAGYIG
jgi:microcystin degradation protein MlrC